MRNNGLSNRFPSFVRHAWHFWYSCLVCGGNRIDALHHIIPPTVRWYVKGDHNRSVYNSCPIHNFKCHIGNDWWLHKEDNLRGLLRKTADALQWLGYHPNDVDFEFLRIYRHLYVDEVDQGEKQSENDFEKYH